MDIKEKIDELHAKEVTPEVFEEVWGESKEEAKKKVMDFVERFLQAKTERDQKKHKRATRTEQKTMAIELAPAAKKVKLDNAIIGQAAIKGTKGKVGKAVGGRMSKGPRGPKGV